MEQLLRKEGIKIVNDTVQNFKEKFWNPMDELGL
jgi:methylated-DNA-protein-cysteine methyltransferase-like protein